MAEYIEREAVMDALLHEQYGYLCEDAISSIPAADVRPVVKAHWTDHRTIEHDGEWYCTACGKEITIYMGADRKDRYNFCPNCGADMRGELGCGRCDECRINYTGTCRYGDENT